MQKQIQAHTQAGVAGHASIREAGLAEADANEQ